MQQATRKFIGFITLSALSFAVNIGITALCHELLHLPEELAYAIALVTIFWQNFLLCRYVVFRSSHRPFWPQVGAFTAATIQFRLAEYLVWLLLLHLLHLHYLVAVILVSGFFTILKFFFLGNRVFPGTGDTITQSPQQRPHEADHSDPLL